MSGSVIVEAALRLAGIAHAMDRPEWLDTAAAMLATVWDDPPDRIRAALSDPAKVWRAVVHGYEGIDPGPRLRRESQPTPWGHASRVPGRSWRGGSTMRSRSTR